MAYVRNPLSQDDTEQSSGVIGTDQQPITSDAPGAARPVSNWTNLSAYIEGNQGSGAQIADKMLEQGNADVTAANNAGADFAKNATKQVDDNTKQDKGFTSLFSNTNSLANATDQQKNDYSAWKNTADYGGPADASQAQGYGDVVNAVGKAKDSAARSYTQDSQYGLAKDSLGKGNQNYNGGMSMLDTVLARQAGGGQKLDDFNAKNTAGNIQTVQDTAASNINSYINAAKGKGQAVSTAATNALQGTLGKIHGNISQRETDNNASGDNRYATDHNLADYAAPEEIAALNNIINGFGANIDEATKQDLLNKSGADNTTIGQQQAMTDFATPVLVPEKPMDNTLKAPQQAGQNILDIITSKNKIKFF